MIHVSCLALCLSHCKHPIISVPSFALEYGPEPKPCSAFWDLESVVCTCQYVLYIYILHSQLLLHYLLAHLQMPIRCIFSSQEFFLQEEPNIQIQTSNMYHFSTLDLPLGHNCYESSMIQPGPIIFFFLEHLIIEMKSQRNRRSLELRILWSDDT